MQISNELIFIKIYFFLLDVWILKTLNETAGFQVSFVIENMHTNMHWKVVLKIVKRLHIKFLN